MFRSFRGVLAQFGSACLLLAGGSALVKLIRAAGGPPLLDPAATFVFAGGMIALGYCGFRYVQLEYRGGIASVLGAFLAFLGAFSFAVLVGEPESDTTFVVVNVAMGLLLTAAGVALLRRGHRRHLDLDRPDLGVAFLVCVAEPAIHERQDAGDEQHDSNRSHRALPSDHLQESRQCPRRVCRL